MPPERMLGWSVKGRLPPMPPAIRVMPPPIESNPKDSRAESIAVDGRDWKKSPPPLIPGDIEAPNPPAAGTMTLPPMPDASTMLKPPPIDDPERLPSPHIRPGLRRGPDPGPWHGCHRTPGRTPSGWCSPVCPAKRFSCLLPISSAIVSCEACLRESPHCRAHDFIHHLNSSPNVRS